MTPHGGLSPHLGQTIWSRVTVMKTMMAALAMMILPTAALTQVTDADGWNSAKWGMTLAQVKAAITYPLDRETYFLGTHTPRFVLRTPEPFTLLDIPVHANFSFAPDDKLVSIMIQVDSAFLDSTHSHSELFDRFRQSLTEKYGRPRFTDDHGRTVVWSLPSTSIRLQWTELAGRPFMAVTYSQADKKSPV
jgi:hypothetical protein